MSKGDAPVIDAALAYSRIVFGGAFVVWLFNTASSVMRGAGDMGTPALAMGLSLVVYIPLCPILVYGWGPMPSLGVAGAAWAMIGAFSAGTLALMRHFLMGAMRLRLRRTELRLDLPILSEIVRLGAAGALNAVLNNAAMILTTALVGRLGVSTLGGYGMALRLEYLVIPIAAALGAAMLTMVGMNIGAGQRARAKDIAWTGGAMTFAVAGSLGLVAATFPSLWGGLFTSDAAVLATSRMYLRTVGLTYGLFGLGLSLYYATMGAARPFWPLAANVVRLIIVATGGLLFGHTFGAVCWIVAVAFATYGTIIVVSLKVEPWDSAAAPERPATIPILASESARAGAAIGRGRPTPRRHNVPGDGD